MSGWHKIRLNQNGQILVSLIVLFPFLLLIVAAYISFSTSSFKLARQDQLHTQAQITADAGADYAVEQINLNNSWTGTGGEITLHTANNIKTTYAVTIVNNSSSSKTIVATGKSYWPANVSTAKSSVSIKVSLLAISSGAFSVASGEGGLVMNNSSKITGGNAYINGTITMSNSAQIGLSTSPATVFVADNVCPVPADSTYPRVCTSADHAAQPISISNTAKIYGNVQANNQISGSGMSSPGLTASSGVAPVALPTYDRAAQKAAVATNLTGSNASCSKNTKTWSANTKITGDVSISGSCVVTVNGNIWITGNLSVSNSAQLVVGNGLGSTRPTIMVDGSTGVSLTNSSTLTSNASGTGFEVITFYSKASCSPDCASVSGSDLYNSQSLTTISLRNTSQAPQTILYAYWSEVDVANSGQIGALIGQTVNLSNTGTITFTTSTGLGTTAWIVNGYRQNYN